MSDDLRSLLESGNILEHQRYEDAHILWCRIKTEAPEYRSGMVMNSDGAFVVTWIRRREAAK